MRRTNGFVLLSVAAAFTFCVLSATAAMADSRQQNKNMWRNLGIGAGVVGIHGLLTHNGTEALLGVAGAAYSANRYEQDRHSQSKAAQARARYYRTNHRTWVNPSDRYYYRSSEDSSLRQQYGDYPNIKYFRSNGHIYYEDLDTHEDYLVRW